MAPDSTMGGHDAMEPWDHPRTIEGYYGPYMAKVTFHCLDLYFTKLEKDLQAELKLKFHEAKTIHEIRENHCSKFEVQGFSTPPWA